MRGVLCNTRIPIELEVRRLTLQVSVEACMILIYNVLIGMFDSRYEDRTENGCSRGENAKVDE